MNRKNTRLAGCVVALLTSVSVASVAHSQTTPTINIPAIRTPIDQNGVDLATGGLVLSDPLLSIGQPSAGGLAHARVWLGNGWKHNYFLTVTTTSTGAVVSIGDRSVSFTLSGGVYTSDQGDGSTLTGTYVYTAPDGTIITFKKPNTISPPTYYYYGTVAAIGTSIVKPNGEKTTLTYDIIGSMPHNPTTNQTRLNSVYDSNGYQLKFIYDSVLVNFYNLQQVTEINNAVDYCDPTVVGTCSGLTQTWPAVSYSTSTSGSNQLESVTDPLGRVTRYTTNASRQLIGIKRPTSSIDNVVIVYDGNGRVSSVTRDGALWTYSWVLSGSTLSATVTDPLSHQRLTTADVNQGIILSDQDALLHKTVYTPDASGRITKAALPEGNYSQYVYDSRGNITSTTTVSKTPGTPANIVTSAVFPTTCAVAVTCNKPTSVTDAKGNITSFTYDSTHGGVLTITAPAIAGVTPQTRYSYTALQAYYKNSAGSIVASSTSAYQLTATSTCRTTASCAGSADELKTTIGYGLVGTANNLLPTSVSSGSGDGVLITTNSATYDSIGNIYSSADPMSDVTRYRFDADREIVGIVGPDPDGAGALKNRARRLTYNADGQVTLAEQGTVLSQSDADWANFVSLQQASTSYDAAGRKLQDNLQASGTTYVVAQFSYDAAGRLDCSAQRMNTAVFGSLPSACILSTQGSFGPDRINRDTYDAADRLIKVTTGYGVSGLARDEINYSYSWNGKVTAIADAKNNVTTYAYDGLDRLSQTFYPSITTPGGSSTTDYEQLTSDPNGNITARRLRDGSTISYTYDVLNRRTYLDLPATGVASDSDVTYTYDLLGHLLQAIDGNSHRVTYAYDALGRSLSEASPWATKTMQYDFAGRRTRLTWQDGFYVTYDYDGANEMTGIHENGGGTLASFGYDDLGRRTSRTLANGTYTTYAFDAISRMTSLNLNNGTNTNAITLSAYSPAGEIGSRIASNDAYAWTAGANVNRGYTPNGLNQYNAISGSTQIYDARGNLTNSGGTGYAYNSKNQMYVSGANGFYYDPAGRLDDASGSNVLFDYDGSNMISELNTSNAAILRRYVFGTGGDEQFVWYEGPGTTDKRYMDQDERGSITRITDGSGSTIALNSYDEYGIPASTNQGRFQYTGQMWLPEIGMYNYKARIYSPTLGRFMQTDPVGYGDGPNWYNYVHSNPITFVDSNGLGQKAGTDDGSGSGSSSTGGGGGGDIVVNGHRPPTFQLVSPPQGPFGGGSRVKARTPQKQSPASIAKNIKDCGGGKVGFTAAGGSIFAVIGGSAVQGSFVTGGGGVGTFETDSWGFGLDLGATVQGGYAPNLDTFTGFSVNFSGSVGRWGGTATRSESNGQWSYSGSHSLPLPGLPRTGGSFSESNTFITSFVCPK